MSGDISAESLSDAKKEQIKLTATYLNGIAIGLVLVGGLSIPSSIAVNATTGSARVLAVGLSLAAFVISPYLHRYARSWLRRLNG